MPHIKEQIIDQLLVMDAQNGDAEAMQKLVSRWYKKLWQYVFRLTDSQATWDITQQCDFFSKKMRWVMINLYVWSFFFMALAIISAVQFFRTDQTKSQIMYAAIFICCSLILQRYK